MHSRHSRSLFTFRLTAVFVAQTSTKFSTCVTAVCHTHLKSLQNWGRSHLLRASPECKILKPWANLLSVVFSEKLVDRNSNSFEFFFDCGSFISKFISKLLRYGARMRGSRPKSISARAIFKFHVFITFSKIKDEIELSSPIVANCEELCSDTLIIGPIICNNISSQRNIPRIQ